MVDWFTIFLSEPEKVLTINVIGTADPKTFLVFWSEPWFKGRPTMQRTICWSCPVLCCARYYFFWIRLSWFDIVGLFEKIHLLRMICTTEKSKVKRYITRLLPFGKRWPDSWNRIDYHATTWSDFLRSVKNWKITLPIRCYPFFWTLWISRTLLFQMQSS